MTITLEMIRDLAKQHEAAKSKAKKEEIAKEHDMLLRGYKAQQKVAHAEELAAQGYGAIIVRYRPSNPKVSLLMTLTGLREVKKAFKKVGQPSSAVECVIAGAFEFLKDVNSAMDTIKAKIKNDGGFTFDADPLTICAMLRALPGLGGFEFVDALPKAGRKSA